jgi:hypothetical protein
MRARIRPFGALRAHDKSGGGGAPLLVRSLLSARLDTTIVGIGNATDPHNLEGS